MNDFEWDPDKAERNAREHGVIFGEAATVFADPLAWVEEDALHSREEDRYRIIGHSVDVRLLVVVFAERRGRIRVIGARPATPRERREYERSIQDRS